MPRSVDPPGLYPTTDLDPASKNLYIDPDSLPKLDPDAIQKSILGGLFRPGAADEMGDKVNELIANWFDMSVEAWNNFVKFLNDIFFGGINLATATLAQAWDAVMGWIGQIAEWFVGLVPIGSLTGEQPNLLARHGEFPSITSIADNPWWVWDSAVTAAPDGTGSARVLADGTTKALRSIVIAVAPGMNLAAQIQVKWAGLICAPGAEPIKLDLVPIVGAGTDDQNELPPVTLFAVENPATDNGWMTIAGNWQVPKTGPKIDGVAMRLVVEPTAAQGMFWWDRGVLRRTGEISQSWVGGLIEQWNATYAAFEADTVEALNRAWKNLLQLFGLESLATDIFLTSAQARELLDNWIIPQLQVTVDSIFAGFANWGIIGEWINQPINAVAQWIYGIFDTGVTANNQIMALMARVQALENPGTQIVDTFNRPAILDWLGQVDPVNSTPGPNYTRYRRGPGAGTIGILKPGHMGWVRSGMLNVYEIARHHQIMDTDNGHISVVFTSGPEPGIFSPASNFLVCRCNDTATNYVEAVIQHNAVWLRHFQNGRTPEEFVDIMAPNPNVFSFSGDLWELLWGWQGFPHRYVLRRNGITIVDYTDPMNRAVIGASNRYVGFGYMAENAWVLSQSAGASLGIFSAVNV